jgi:hypothetical protein
MKLGIHSRITPTRLRKQELIKDGTPTSYTSGVAASVCVCVCACVRMCTAGWP